MYELPPPRMSLKGNFAREGDEHIHFCSPFYLIAPNGKVKLFADPPVFQIPESKSPHPTNRNNFSNPDLMDFPPLLLIGTPRCVSPFRYLPPERFTVVAFLWGHYEWAPQRESERDGKISQQKGLNGLHMVQFECPRH